MRSDRYTAEQWATVDAFHGLYYGLTPSWLGIPVLKNAFDLMIYQEIIWNTRPELIVECGTAWGGSTRFFASICDLVDCGEIVSIDMVPEAGVPQMYEMVFGERPAPPLDTRPRHPRIRYLLGDVLSREISLTVMQMAAGRRTMVVLDSTHTTEHVLQECALYSRLVTPGCYLSIEDINLYGHPEPYKNPGPLAATYTFLERHPEFKWNLGWTDRYLMTQNAYLMRMEDTDD